jgi:kynureninase
MPIAPEDLYRSPNALAPHYSRFRVSERLLLNGHSHQAWPDCGFHGQQLAWQDAADYLDKKWEYAFAKADLVREGYRRLLDARHGHIALGPSTHDLVVRFLSALPLRVRPRIVTSDGEFHSLRRQLERLAEEGIEVVKVPSQPASRVAERLIAAADSRTAAVMISSVFFHTGHIVGGLGSVMEKCRHTGAAFFIDVYHALNVTPFSVTAEGLDQAFIAGGGYKYCQLGEGNAFLHIPEHCTLRPIVTGWFSEFESLAQPTSGTRIAYGKGPVRFAGSTYDPTSHYRAVEVFAFFKEVGLTPDLLREVSRHQVGLLAGQFDALDANPRLITRDRTTPLESVGGFLVLYSPRAAGICQALFDRGVLADYRGNSLRLGPAPYMSDRQLIEAVNILGDILRHPPGHLKERIS